MDVSRASILSKRVNSDTHGIRHSPPCRRIQIGHIRLCTRVSGIAEYRATPMFAFAQRVFAFFARFRARQFPDARNDNEADLLAGRALLMRAITEAHAAPFRKRSS